MTSIKNVYHTKNEIFWLLLFIGLTCFYIVLATLANADTTAGRFAINMINMDERLIFDGVKYILHPDKLKRFVWYVSDVDGKAHGDFIETVDGGLKSFIWSVVDGGKHQYGRSLWNSIAMLSFLPEIFFGDPGQIFAERMVQVIFLLSAFILLTVTFLKHWALRFLLLASLLAMPYTYYYMTQPKPEPLQLLFIAVFLYYFMKNEMRLKGGYWIFLGLAFGTKISTFPLIGVFLFAASLKYFPHVDSKKMASEFIGALGFFLIGLAISVPILLPNIAASIIVFKAIDSYLNNKPAMQGWLIKIGIIASLVVMNLLAALVLYYKFKFITGLAIWGGSTFLQTTHEGDRSSIGFGSWINYFLHDWMVAPVAITALLIVNSSALAIRFLMQKSEDRIYPYWLNSKASFFVVLSGLVLNISICLFTHRLWGIYLLPGMVLILVGLFAIFESYLLTDDALLRKHKNQDNKSEYYFSLSGLFLISTITFVWWLPQSVIRFDDLANRTSSLEYKKQYQSYFDLTEFLTKFADHKNKRLIVSLDANLFILQSNNKYEINEFWGPYTLWETNPDVIIMSDLYMQKRKKWLQKDMRGYDAVIRQLDGYNKYVIDKGAECLLEKCYERYLELANGGEILVLMQQKSGK